MLQAQHGSSDGACLGTRNADYANPATAGRSGDGDDGVVQVHKEIVAGAVASKDGRVIRQLGAAGNFSIAAIDKEVVESRTEWEQEIQR